MEDHLARAYTVPSYSMIIIVLYSDQHLTATCAAAFELPI